MALKNRKSISSMLFGRFSLKAKIVIFCILCIFAVILVVKNSYWNRKNKITVENPNKNITQNSVIRKSNTDITQDKKNNERFEEEYKEAQKFFSDKQYSKAIDKADEIINQNNKFYKAYNIKGIALCYSNNYEEGMKNIDKALQLNSNFGYARFNKALAYELYGKYDDALNWYDKDLEVEKYIWSYYGKASIYGRRADVLNTVKFLKTAIDMSPDIKSIAREEKDFDPVKNSREFQDLIK
ncbi:tetratricopeptide repeat protein [Clostridium sp. Mt-5]|uniref:Tetratricopeptide repeat protein n=1 Tax=Clostridium moutaii TaxID=3240932 RepID=A0ABV4BT28_9CLOT